MKLYIVTGRKYNLYVRMVYCTGGYYANKIKSMKKIFLLSVFFLLGITVFAQRKIPAELQTRLQGKTKVVDIMREVNRYYDFGRANVTNEQGGEEEWEGNDYQWWKKWEYWAMRRLNPDGTLANYRSKNYQAQQEVNNRFGALLEEAERNFRQSNYRPDETGRSAPPDVSSLSYGGWSEVGPFDRDAMMGSGTNIDINGLARMDRISFHPSNANIMYTGSPSGSVYKTTDGGSTWNDIGRGLPLGVACLEVAPSNGNIIYVFSGDGDSHRSTTFVFTYDVSPISQGLFKSTNGGLTWTKCADMYTGPNDLVGHQMTISQTNSNYVFVATDQGLYRTTDGGSSWTQVRAGNYYDVEFRPYDDSTVYSSTATTIERSINGGRTGTWTTSTLTPAPSITPQRIELGVRENTTGVQSTFVYALMSAATTGSHAGIYLSTDIGATFNRQSNTPNIIGSTTTGSDGGSQARYDAGICVKPTDANYIVTAGMCVWRSNGSNGGTSMVFSTIYREGFGAASAYIHPDIHDVQYNPLNNNLYACTDGGVYRSTDDGVTWTDLSNGLVGTQFYHMGMRDSDGDGEVDGVEMIAGAQDNGVKYRTTGGVWRHILCCDGYSGVIKGSTPGYGLMTFNGGIYRTTNGGVSMFSEGGATAFSPVAIDYNNDDTMYVASSSLLRSFDGGQTYTTIGVDVNNIIVTCPSNSARLYGSSSGKINLRRSDDRGSTWTTKSGNPGWPGGSPIVTDCKPWPSNSLEIYTSFGGYTAGVKVYRSFDGGDTWANYSGTLPNIPVHSLCVATEGVYAGTELGVFFRADGAADWTPFYTGMPNALVTDIWAAETGLVYASTFGHGTWLANRYSACPANITVTGTLDGQHYYEAGTTATVTAFSEGGEGTNIYVKSNGTVEMMPGFEIKAGTFYKAWIGPCSTGGIPTGRTATVVVPHLTEIDLTEKRPAAETAYFSVINGKIEFNILQAGRLEMYVKTVSGDWEPFYGTAISMPGFYAIPAPKLLSGEFKIKINSTELTQL
jgi:photosystem II stability/assembly factor-like uncharacterized protein